MSVTGSSVPLFVFGIAALAAALFVLIIVISNKRRQNVKVRSPLSTRQLLKRLSMSVISWSILSVILIVIEPSLRPELLPAAVVTLILSLGFGTLIVLLHSRERSR